MNNPQRGFGIVSAIFLLVVLAFLGTAMVTFSVNQQQTAALDVAGERAYQAARAGVEWGAFQALQNGACAANTNLAPLAGTLSGFSITVTCASTVASEVSAASAAGGVVTVYDLTSTAAQGTPGEPDRVERQVQASIAR